MMTCHSVWKNGKRDSVAIGISAGKKDSNGDVNGGKEGRNAGDEDSIFVGSIVGTVDAKDRDRDRDGCLAGNDEPVGIDEKDRDRYSVDIEHGDVDSFSVGIDSIAHIDMDDCGESLVESKCRSSMVNCELNSVHIQEESTTSEHHHQHANLSANLLPLSTPPPSYPQQGTAAMINGS
eukprot:8148612-Ditylum_brightwellii.AAC.1